MPVLRLEPNGPEGITLLPLNLDEQDFQSGLPEQYWHIYFEDAASGLTVGVWTTTDMQEAFGPYPGDEFMHILEGQVCMLDEAENATIVKEGETFFVHNGIPASWKQVGFCRKFFMTLASSDTSAPPADAASDSIVILREDELAAKFSSSVSQAGVKQKDVAAVTNATGEMTAGMWETEPFETPMEPFPAHEFAQILEGTVTIIQENGVAQNFSKGDCFFISRGTVCSWKCDVALRKFYCMFEGASVSDAQAGEELAV